jgi:hypothetical protein
MLAYEFYRHDEAKGYELIGILPERRKKPERITKISILTWAQMILEDKTDIGTIFLLKINITDDTREIVHLGPLRAFREEFG